MMPMAAELAQEYQDVGSNLPRKTIFRSSIERRGKPIY
jgi:hypothetical protein